VLDRTAAPGLAPADVAGRLTSEVKGGARQAWEGFECTTMNAAW